MTDHTFASVAAAFAAWRDSRSDDLAQAEARIDSLIQTLWEQSRMLGEQDGELIYVKAMLHHALNTIERQQRDLARKDAELARMRTDPARRPTRTESIVRGLNALYAFESPEEVQDGPLHL